MTPLEKKTSIDLALKERPDFAYIFDLIPAGSRVLDLGCGNGTLLYLLKEKESEAKESKKTKIVSWNVSNEAFTFITAT